MEGTAWGTTSGLPAFVVRRPFIADALRNEIVAEAGERCGYCRTPQALVNVRFEIEHLVPASRGGDSTRENLWLSCPTCNRFKSDRVSGVDPVTGRKVRLFHPRRQPWDRHFRWNGTTIIGKTAAGRATVETLQLNHWLHLTARHTWQVIGVFRPEDEAT